MSTRRPQLDPTAVQPLLTQLRQAHAGASFTLAQAEQAILALFRQLGPELVEGLLQGAAPPTPTEAKKGGRRCVRAGRSCAGIVCDRAR